MTHCVSFCRLPQALDHLCLSLSGSDLTSVALSFVNLFTFPWTCVWMLNIHCILLCEQSLLYCLFGPVTCLLHCFSDSCVGRDDVHSVFFLVASGFIGLYCVLLPRVFSSVKLTPWLLSFLKIFLKENMSKFFLAFVERSLALQNFWSIGSVQQAILAFPEHTSWLWSAKA